MQQNTPQAAPPSAAWMILAVVFFSSLAAPLNQFKAPPVLQDVTQAFGVTLGTGGWLMSVFSMIGMILALPSGFIIGRLGANMCKPVRKLMKSNSRHANSEHCITMLNQWVLNSSR